MRFIQTHKSQSRDDKHFLKKTIPNYYSALQILIIKINTNDKKIVEFFKVNAHKSMDDDKTWSDLFTCRWLLVPYRPNEYIRPYTDAPRS